MRTFEVIQSRDTVDEWRVEAIEFDEDGQVYVALFSGPQARERAEEYAAFKSREVTAQSRTVHGEMIQHMELARVWAHWNGHRGTEAQVLRIMQRLSVETLIRKLSDSGVVIR